MVFSFFFLNFLVSSSNFPDFLLYSSFEQSYISPKIELILFQYHEFDITIKKEKERDKEKEREDDRKQRRKANFPKTVERAGTLDLFGDRSKEEGRGDAIKYSGMGTRREIAYSFHTRTASKKTANQIDSSSGICSWLIRSRYRVGVSFVGQPLEILLVLAV